jgi:membrane-bound serine protease (ClpP class)
MSGFALVILLFLVAAVILVAEIFLPAQGVLGIVGIGVLAYAVYQAYCLDQGGGHVTLLCALILVPTLAVVGFKAFPKTPLGKRIAPENPHLNAAEFAPHHEQLKRLIGRRGTSVTPLRPVGTCMIDGQRVNCIAEAGLIEGGMDIEVLRVRGAQLEVRPVPARERVG